ncbi:hypothetical protein BT96DRAFT_927043, partial [Gymnopus androsaceus JB14]
MTVFVRNYLLSSSALLASWFASYFDIALHVALSPITYHYHPYHLSLSSILHLLGSPTSHLTFIPQVYNL